MWQETDVSRILVFQRLIIDDESMIVTIKYNDRAGTVTAETEFVQSYMTRAQVVELINEMTGGGATPAGADVFYTADGQIFSTVDAAVLHVQKGEQ